MTFEANSTGYSFGIARHFRRTKIDLQCEIVTPMFLGNASQDAELRAAPFKAQLRYWWRVAYGHDISTEDLFEKESLLFGKGGKEAGRSLVTVQVYGSLKKEEGLFSEWQKMEKQKVKHPEVDKPMDGLVNPLLYLGGIGLMNPIGRVKHSYFPPKSNFTVCVTFPEAFQKDLVRVMDFVRAFGAIGARCRNGWGSFQTSNSSIPDQEPLITAFPWKQGMQRHDYPNCFGMDDRGFLLWGTQNISSGWAECMREIAKAYISLRVIDFPDPTTKMTLKAFDPGGKDKPAERHLLGFPLTHHEALQAQNWGNHGRHASPLRFVVRKSATGFVGLALHLPFRLSDEMNRDGKKEYFSVENQIEVWDRVHRKLDILMERVSLEDLRRYI
ncbi:MAG: hypothetical protein HY882_06010 [Deltaproteobacteria bacterium]|nr:hypothetical protein [Deltaproteobacteria bacterium]